jgi:branched-subunit amino acid aminotransferase/4-amino-4-deoxychorismate lyase
MPSRTCSSPFDQPRSHRFPRCDSNPLFTAGSCPPSNVGLFGSLWRRRIAQRNGFDDVLFTDADSTISEAATSNIGLLDGEELVWPQRDCLEGVTMRLINQILDGRTTTRPVTLSQLAEVDAVFATNAAVGVRPIGALDGFRWPDPHPTLNALCTHYAGVNLEQL